jgi:hypothetical protein
MMEENWPWWALVSAKDSPIQRNFMGGHSTMLTRLWRLLYKKNGYKLSKKNIEENENTMDHGVLEVTQACDVPKGAKVLSINWVLGLLAWVNCVLAFLIVGTKSTVNRVKASMPKHSTTEEQGEMQDDVGCKIKQDQTERWMKIGCEIEQEYFGCKIDRDKTKQGEVMSKNDGVPSSKNMVQTYRNGVLHRVRELSRFMSSQMDAHLSRKYKVLNYIKHTASLRKVLKPYAVWDGVNKSLKLTMKMV